MNIEIIDEHTKRKWLITLPHHPKEKLSKEVFGNTIEHFYIDLKHSPPVRQGLCKSYYPDESLASESYYEKGLLHGPVKYWNTEGQLLAHSFYVEGKKCGPFMLWYSSGKLYSEQHFVEGKREGKQLYFYENGQLRTRMLFQKGDLVGLLEQFYETGQPWRKIEYEAGKRTGADTIWFQTGEPLMEAHYEAAVPVHELKLFHDNGQLAEHYHYLGEPWKFDVHRYDREGDLWQEGKTLENGHFEEKSYDKQGRLIRQTLAQRSQTGQTESIKILSGSRA